MNFVDINTKKFTGINYANAITETFYIQFCSAECDFCDEIDVIFSMGYIQEQSEFFIS